MLKFIKNHFSKNILNGLGAVTYLNGVKSLIPIISVPVFIKIIGVQNYGEWILINSIVFYFTYVDLGLNRILANSMTIDVAAGKINTALRNFQKASTFILIISFLFILFDLLLFFWDYISIFVNSDFLGAETTKMIFFYLVLNAIITLNFTYLEAVFRSSDNFSYGTYLISSIDLFSRLILLGVLLFSEDLVLSVFIMSAISLSGFLITIILLKKKCIWLKIKLLVPDKIFFKEFLKPSLSYFFYEMGNSLNMQGLNIVVGTMLGPLTLSIFSTIRTMVNSVKTFVNLISHAYWPEFSRVFGRKDYPSSKKLLNQAFKINMYGTIILILFFFIFGKDIYLIWLNHSLEFNNLFFILLLINLVTYSLWDTNLYFLIASNKHSLCGIIFIVFSFLLVISSIFTIKQFGIEIIPAFTIITDILFCIVVYNELAKVFQEGTFSFVLYQLRKLLLMAPNPQTGN